MLDSELLNSIVDRLPNGPQITFQNLLVSVRSDCRGFSLRTRTVVSTPVNRSLKAGLKLRGHCLGVEEREGAECTPRAAECIEGVGRSAPGGGIRGLGPVELHGVAQATVTDILFVNTWTMLRCTRMPIEV